MRRIVGLIVIGFCISILVPALLYAQEKKQKNLRFSILGGPGYTPDFGFLLGGSTLITFHAKGMEKFQQRSIIPAAFAITFGNGVGASMVVRPHIFLSQDRIRLYGQFIYKYTGDNYYGVGYATNHSRPRGEETTRFDLRQLQLNPIVLFRLGESNFFAGPSVDVIRDKMVNPSVGVATDPDYIRAGGGAAGLDVWSVGIGGNISYDTRDIPANAYRGVYFDLDGHYYTPGLGGTTRFGAVSLDYRQYMRLSQTRNAGTLTWMVNSRMSFGDVPFMRMPLSGSPFDLRGYYMGQYRDKTSHIAMTEYRYKVENTGAGFWNRLLNRVGFAAWGGVGFMGPAPTRIEGVLPNFGIGLRIELQPRMNFRMDLGYSPLEKQTLLYFNMTEAF